MEIKTLKSLTLQLRLPDGPNGEERWHPACFWGHCTTDVDAEAYARLRTAQDRWPTKQYRLLKTYEVTEIIE